MASLVVIDCKTLVATTYEGKAEIEKAQLNIYEDTTRNDIIETIDYLLKTSTFQSRDARRQAEILEEQRNAASYYADCEVASWAKTHLKETL